MFFIQWVHLHLHSGCVLFELAFTEIYPINRAIACNCRMRLNNTAHLYLGVSYRVHAFEHSYVSSITEQKRIGKLNDTYLGKFFFVCFLFFVFKWRRGVLVSGTSLTNGLIQTDHDTKKVGQKRMRKKKKCATISCALMHV